MLISEVNGASSVPFAPFGAQFSFGAAPKVPWAPSQQSLLSGKDLKSKFTLMSKYHIKESAVTAKFQKSIF